MDISPHLHGATFTIDDLNNDTPGLNGLLVGAMKSGPKPVGFFFGKYPHDTEVNLVRS
jgi:hypothetical protein